MSFGGDFLCSMPICPLRCQETVLAGRKWQSGSLHFVVWQFLDGLRRSFRVKMLSKFWVVNLVFRAFGMKFDGGQDRAIRFA